MGKILGLREKKNYLDATWAKMYYNKGMSVICVTCQWFGCFGWYVYLASGFYIKLYCFSQLLVFFFFILKKMYWLDSDLLHSVCLFSHKFMIEAEWSSSSSYSSYMTSILIVVPQKQYPCIMISWFTASTQLCGCVCVCVLVCSVIKTFLLLYKPIFKKRWGIV